MIYHRIKEDRNLLTNCFIDLITDIEEDVKNYRKEIIDVIVKIEKKPIEMIIYDLNEKRIMAIDIIKNEENIIGDEELELENSGNDTKEIRTE